MAFSICSSRAVLAEDDHQPIIATDVTKGGGDAREVVRCFSIQSRRWKRQICECRRSCFVRGDKMMWMGMIIGALVCDCHAASTAS